VDRITKNKVSKIKVMRCGCMPVNAKISEIFQGCIVLSKKKKSSRLD